MVKPMFVKQIRKHGKVVKSLNTEVLNPMICSRSTIRKAQIMLEGVVERGTASNLRSANLKIAGKTGTNQIYNKDYGYKMGSKVSYQASFVGYFPADNPKYSCIVVVNSPSRDVYYGNRVAGPVFLEIANKIYANSLDLQVAIKEYDNPDLPYSKNGNRVETAQTLKKLNISISDQASEEWVNTEKRDEHVRLDNKKMIPNLVPDVRFMGLKDAVYLLENAGLNVQVVGRGSVRSQSIMPGKRITKGDKITLTMSFTEG
jgi:cell division protein FtsI (penicillin-binding protein 3)